MTKRSWILMGLVFALAPVLAFAVDGQVLINQSTVMAAGGFPYIITQPGSYKLSGNLAVPVGSDGIHITTPNVTLDLNGFSITSTDPPQTFNAGVVSVLGAVGPSGITIRNGKIRGFNVPIGAWGQFSILEDLVLEIAPGPGVEISFGPNTRIWHVHAPGHVILVTCPSIVVETTALGFQTTGGAGCVLVNNATN